MKPHIEDLRARLLRVIFVFGVLWMASFLYWKEIYHFIAHPLIKVMGEEKVGQMIFTGLTEPVVIALKIATAVSLLLTFPYLLYQIWGFVAPALFQHEKRAIKKYTLPIIFWGSVMFFLGASFAYYVAMPIIFKVMITFGGPDFVPLLRVREYVSLFSKLILGFGISFELPVVVYYLTRVGLILPSDLIEFSRYAIVIIFALAAILTPPDLLSQFLMAVPMLVLYGVSILISYLATPDEEIRELLKRKKEREEDKEGKGE